MPSLEKAERIGGAGLLGVPTFDFFVWLLDNYARGELLMNLHEQLPPWLINPAFAFGCMCGGLGLLYLSHQQQLRRILARPSQLVDVEQYRGKERPGWLLPLVWVTLVTLVSAPALALVYSLRYKGTLPPQAHLQLKPPLICKTADCFSSKPKSHPKPPQPPTQTQTCAPGAQCAQSSGQSGGFTGQVTLGAKTWDMVMNATNQQEMIDKLKAIHGSIRVEWLMFDPDSLKFSGGILYTFTHAGWTENRRPSAAGFMCTPAQDWDCHGLSVSVRDKNSDLAKTAFDALSILHEPLKFGDLDKDLPDDLVVVWVFKP